MKVENNHLLKTLKLLYVEDDEVQRNELASFLKRRVDKLYLASNGEEGLEKFRQFQPNAIICDLRMPKIDGLEMAAKIRKINRVVPIIVLTALSDKETILSSVNLNITNYLIKPVDIKKLVVVLEETAKSLKDIGAIDENDFYDRERLNALKNEITKYIKTETGKGPNEIRLLVKDGLLEIRVLGALTNYEKSLLKLEKNLNLVNYNRDIFYQDRTLLFESRIKEIIGHEVSTIKVKTNCESDETILLFSL